MSIVLPKSKVDESFEESLVISSCVITQKPGDKYVSIEQKSAEYEIKGNEPLKAKEHTVKGKIHRKNISKYFADINGQMFFSSR